jgi:hypothetical protein
MLNENCAMKIEKHRDRSLKNGSAADEDATNYIKSVSKDVAEQAVANPNRLDRRALKHRRVQGADLFQPSFMMAFFAVFGMSKSLAISLAMYG